MLAGDYDVCRNKQENAEGNLCSGFTHEKKLRLLLLLSVNMLHGLEDRSWHHCPPPKRCGFQNRNIMNLVPELFTTSVFKSTIDRIIKQIQMKMDQHDAGWFCHFRLHVPNHGTIKSSLLESSSRELNTDSYENCGILQTQCSEPDELSDAEEDPTLRRKYLLFDGKMFSLQRIEALAKAGLI
ncbi:hypothetical protein pdam_00019813 [Pocillopora damicornis]|uniref:Uncharacterized protein n=1 Tax=Pocillopora damicornis TaxID=46731 RepID=A0A3M6TRF7_POCDA|nr:hypothetical protein pdam_00019813 [Pocillopora damicornis]